jgi:hypothetical protein
MFGIDVADLKNKHHEHEFVSEALLNILPTWNESVLKFLENAGCMAACAEAVHVLLLYDGCGRTGY